MLDNYCDECNKAFRSSAGLNGHNQWKHNKSVGKTVANTVTGKTVEMFEIVQKQLDVIRDEQENLKDMVMGKRENNSPSAPAHPVGHYACLGCWEKGADVALQPGEKTCPGCGGKNNWAVALV